MSLINREDLIAEYDRVHVGEPGKARQLMCDAPTVEERKTGKWIKAKNWGIRCYQCNQCGNYLEFDGVNAGRGDANFCPNCGADMREGHDA